MIRTRNQDRWHGLLLIAMAWVMTAGIGNDIVWDDWIVFENDVLRGWEGLATIWIRDRPIRGEPHYWPVTYTSFWIENLIWGTHPVMTKATNIAIHSMNTAMVWQVLTRLKVPGSLLAGVVFAVHPVQVETVAMAIGRKDLLATMFMLIATVMWMKDNTTTRRRVWVVTGLYLLAVLSKSSAIMLPVGLVIIDAWRAPDRPHRELRQLWPWTVVAGITAVGTVGWPEAGQYTAAEQVLIASQTIWANLGVLVWPVDLPGIHPLWKVDAGAPEQWLIAGASVLAGIMAWMMKSGAARPIVLAGTWYAAMLVPTSGIVEHSFMMTALIADRYQYMACIAPVAVLSAGLAMFAERRERMKAAMGWIAITTVTFSLASTSWVHARIYTDEVRFFEHVAEHNPAARDVWLNLAGAYLAREWYDKAKAAADQAIIRDPDSSHPVVIRAVTRLRTGEIQSGIADLDKAIRIDPDNPDAYYNLGQAQAVQGDFDSAEHYWKLALGIEPGYAPALIGLTALLVTQRRDEEAIRLTMATAHSSLGITDRRQVQVYAGIAYARTGRWKLARENLQDAMQGIGTVATHARHELAVMLARQGRIADAATTAGWSREEGRHGIERRLAVLERWLQAQRRDAEAHELRNNLEEWQRPKT